VLAEAGADRLTCGEAEVVPRWLVRISARDLNAGEKRLAIAEVGELFSADPTGTRAWLAAVASQGAALDGAVGLDGAEKRASAAWSAAKGEGIVGSDRADLWNLQRRALSIWTTDDAERLALTETDIEGWIRYISLCREAQGGDPMRLSIADRTTVYADLAASFRSGTREEKLAILAVGPFWPQVKAAWAAASYEQQQAWIAAAPLPPPMTATSLGYAEAIVQGDLRRHVAILHERLGPLELGWGEGEFTPLSPAGPSGVKLEVPE